MGRGAELQFGSVGLEGGRQQGDEQDGQQQGGFHHGYYYDVGLYLIFNSILAFIYIHTIHICIYLYVYIYYGHVYVYVWTCICVLTYVCDRELMIKKLIIDRFYRIEPITFPFSPVSHL